MFKVSWNAVSLVACSVRRYFGEPSTGACNHFAIVFLDNPVSRAISRSDFFPRTCKRRILPIMSMVINPHSLAAQNCSRVGQTPGSVLGWHTRQKWLRFRSASTK